MVEKKSMEKQLEIEARFQKLSQEPLRPGETLQQAYGEYGDWSMEMGPYKLLLLPVNGEWVYYDFVHGEWAKTGYKAGEARFYLVGDEDIEVEEMMPGPKSKEKKAPAPQPGLISCSGCGASVNQDSRFCAYCGADVAQNLPRVCPGCGADVQEAGARFCSQCGTALV